MPLTVEDLYGIAPATAFSARLSQYERDGEHRAVELRLGLHHVREVAFPTMPGLRSQLEGMRYALLTSSEAHGESRDLYGHGEDVLLDVRELAGGLGQFRLAARTPELADARRDELRAQLALEPEPDPRVPVLFWTMSAHGPRPISQLLEAPVWADIEHNYPAGMRGDLERAMQADSTLAKGVALWWGEPGTGKTTALRALAREWSDWCDIHVIIDPEVFLGDQASYLVDVLMASNAHHAYVGTAHHFALGMDDGVDAIGGYFDGEEGMPTQLQGFAGPPPPSPPFGMGVPAQGAGPRAKLIVLEDAGELVSADARVSSGQALSRLLNLTDGMLGQGQNLSVLVTTNEEVGALHPAIQRPGRCWSQVEFPTLPLEEAEAWLREHDVEAELGGPATLAELYELARSEPATS